MTTVFWLESISICLFLNRNSEMNLLKGCLQVINTNSKGESKTLDLAEIHSVGVGGLDNGWTW